MRRESGFDPTDGVCWQFGNPSDPWPCKCPAHANYVFGESTSAYFGRCRSGKRWFWVAHSPFNDIDHKASGLAETEDEAIDAAMAAIRGFRLGVPIRAIFSANVASYWLKQLNKEKRAARPASKAKDTPVVEYIYGWSKRYQIIKRTKQRVYYLKKGEDIDERGEPIVYDNVRDYSNEGEVGFMTYAYLAADERRHRLYFTTLEALLAERERQRRQWPGLEQPDIAALKQAMADAHPDHGGSAAAFIAARAAYVTARRMLRTAGGSHG